MYAREFHKSIENDEYPQAQRLALYIKQYINPKNFIDFGCSTGLYLNEVKKFIPDGKGYEFSQEAIDCALCQDIIHFDLTIPLNIEKKENTLGLCLEVLEHIDDANYEQVLLNITNCDILIFSAATPGQGGIGHINCRNKIDWIRRFHNIGWIIDLDKTKHMLEYIKNGYHMGWFANNAMILVKA